MNPYLVVFTKNTAVIVHGKHEFKWAQKSKYLVNPCLADMDRKRIPRIFWKEQMGRIVEMTPDEKRDRLDQIKQEPLDTYGERHLYPYALLILILLITMLALIVRYHV